MVIVVFIVVFIVGYLSNPRPTSTADFPPRTVCVGGGGYLNTALYLGSYWP